MLLSSRELSSIIFIEDIYNEPKISFILGDKELYEGTSYYEYVYSQKNNFRIHLGQHTVHFIDDDILYLYNNNYNFFPETCWFNSKKYDNEMANFCSFFYLYKIDHTNKTYELIEQIELPYSSLMSSVQILKNGNRVTFSREAKEYREYDENDNLIAVYCIDRYSYRIYKYDFKNFWFD